MAKKVKKASKKVKKTAKPLKKAKVSAKKTTKKVVKETPKAENTPENIDEPSVPNMDYPRILVTDKFIMKNKLDRMGQKTIAEKLELVLEEPGMFDFRPEVLINHLTFENAKKYLKEEFIEKVNKGEEKHTSIITIEQSVQGFLDYMVFAWGKAEDQRGLSAERSIQKLSIWLWILGRPDLEELINRDELYNPYGAPALIAVCENLGIEVPNSVIEFSKVKC